MSGNLSASDFAAYFTAIHEREPFPWQRELAERVVTAGWPSLLDIPTGLGKTATIDIAIFALACEAASPSGRTAPLRTFFVVDRRIVVDDAYERARKIAEKLLNAQDGVLRSVADALRLFTADVGDVLPETPRPPLAVGRLRGGVPRDTDWAETPSQPLVVVSTVDQVGSRLLFRGYGVSPRSAPIHAGLVGADALWLLDEVHLAQPLEETLTAIGGTNGTSSFSTLPRSSPFVVCRLSATPGSGNERRFDFFDEKRLVENRAHHEIALRLDASKPATVERYRSESALAVAGATRKIVAQAPHPARFGVIVNTIAAARAVFDTLHVEFATNWDVHLLVGRVRDLDRDRIVTELETFKADANRSSPKRHQVLVATQTVETGADFDFDALVTEIAPLDALRQRFGRLNRLGRSPYSEAIILVPDRTQKDAWGTIKSIYGSNAEATSNWLKTIAVKNKVDFGLSVMHETLRDVDVSSLGAPRLHAPVLLPSHVRDFAMTAAVPSYATPDVELYLHGRRTVHDVGIVWRADIDYRARQHGAAVDDAIVTSLNACPIASPEVLDLPIYHARRLIERALGSHDVERDEETVTDVPISDAGTSRTNDDERSKRTYCLVQRGGRGDGLKWITTAELRVGNTVIVPCSFGGYDDHGWSATSSAWVRDVGLEANQLQRDRTLLRLTRETLYDVLLSEARERRSDGNGAEALAEVSGSVSPTWRHLCDAVSADVTAPQAARALNDIVPPAWQPAITNLLTAEGTVFRALHQRDDLEGGFVLYESRRKRSSGNRGVVQTGQASTTSDDASSNTGKLVTLSDHSSGVRRRAERYARETGMSDRLATLVSLAAYLHDSGKADERFQADLRNEASLYVLGLVDARPEQQYAKSAHAFVPNAPRATPHNFRHEALSVALAEKHPLVAALDNDERDLVLWLIGTHHGFGRPFFPISSRLFEGPRALCDALEGPPLEADLAEMPIRLDGGWFALAERITRRYGPWELARLESVLRLADHRQSAYEQSLQDRQTEIAGAL